MKDENAEDGVRVERFFGLIRVFASATLEPENFMSEDHWSRASGRNVLRKGATLDVR